MTLNSASDSIRTEKSLSSAVPPEKWTEHFRTLHSDSNDTEADTQINFQATLKKLENSSSNYHSTLDKTIDHKDIAKALTKLKNKKAASNDKIKNEMIKTSCPILKESYRKLFNIILSAGIYPYHGGVMV